MWAFDDKERGILREPFVGETNRIIDFILGNSNNTTLLFSATDFPEAHKAELIGLSDENGGAWYKLNDIEGWLCPTLFAFFETAPQTLFVKAA